jgi:hypothetical protein
MSGKKSSLFVLVLITLASRLIPHPPNFTALISFAIFAGFFYSRQTSMLWCGCLLIFSDLLLAYYSDFPIWGDWSFFTYTGTLLVAGLSACTLAKKHNLLCFASLSLSFWLWTNVGVWLCTNLYEKTAEGLLACLSAALPFLSNQLLGDVCYLLLFWFIYCRLVLASQYTMRTSITKINN